MNLKFNNVTKKFVSLRGNIPAVNDINLEIKDKEFFILLGPSGCGKSTILNLVAGLEKPSSGEIWFGNKLVASKERKVFLSPKERNIAMVFQSYALYPHLNVYENIAFPLRIQKVSENAIKESVEKAAEKLKISSLFAAKPAELSGGQRQRVAIARAIVRQPEIFLLDEPLSNLDAQLRVSTRIELKQLQRNLGITTVYVTHDQVEAMTLGDRVAVLRNGKIEQVGTPEELYSNPVNTFVATFIGSPPMNLIKTTVVEEKNNFFAVVSNQKITIPKDKIEYIKNQRTKDFILGIRPEHMYPSQKGPFKVKINSIELIGREALVHVLLGNTSISFITTNKEYKVGDEINITFDIDKIKYYK